MVPERWSVKANLDQTCQANACFRSPQPARKLALHPIDRSSPDLSE
jgi:hypothetical protein